MRHRPKVKLSHKMVNKDDIRLTLTVIIDGDTTKFGYKARMAYEFWLSDPNDISSPEPKGRWVLFHIMVVEDAEQEKEVMAKVEQERQCKTAWISIDDARQLYEWMLEDGWEEANTNKKKVVDKSEEQKIIDQKLVIEEMAKNMAKEIDKEFVKRLSKNKWWRKK